MEKIRIKIAEVDKVPKGYWVMNEPKEQEIFEKIRLELPQNKRYIQHFSINEWTKTTGEHIQESWTGDPIPLGTLTFFADVYVEDR
jgi:hypothetical protein